MKKINIRTITTVLIVTAMQVATVSSMAATASDWSVLGDTEINAQNSAVTIDFDTRSVTDLTPTADLIVGGSSPASIFKGDISSYTGFRFKVNGNGFVPKSATLVIYLESGAGNRIISRDWTHDGVGVSSVAGEWTINEIPLVMDKGWVSSIDFAAYSYSETNNAVHWDSDLQNVNKIILRLRQTGVEAQSFSVDQFQMIGEGGPTEPAQLTSVQAYFGVETIEDVDPSLDSDKDGMSDVNELLAGMDPKDASSVLSAKGKKGADGNIVTWQGVLGSTYGVLRSSNLTDGFELIQGASDIYAGFTGEMSYEDTDPENGANFYKIVKY